MGEIAGAQDRTKSTPAQMNACQREDLFLDGDPVNGFFKGLLFILPGSILLWIIVIWGVRSLIY
jgi:hypothetical protein